jgi:hypothetical protein
MFDSWLQNVFVQINWRRKIQALQCAVFLKPSDLLIRKVVQKQKEGKLEI